MESFNPARAEALITLAYALTLIPVLFARTRAPATRERLFWAIAALAILALGLNKPLDLQTNLTQWARDIARDGGWFDRRREVQALFIAGLAGTTTLAGILLAWWARHMRPAVWLALAGLLALAAFVTLRAASFHHVDVALRTPLLGTRAWVTLELAGITLVALGALATLRRP
jgi:multidrug efflux pump subunit AcrB